MISLSGIRGIVGQSIDAETVGDFAAAFGTCLGGRKVIIGRDSRTSGAEFCDAAADMLMRCGCPVVNLGVVTTPGTALMVRRHQAAGGVVITASHNPGDWNGLKFLTPEGLAPPLEQARRIWSVRDARDFKFVPAEQVGSVIEDPTTHDKHVAAVRGIVDPSRIAGRKLRVVLDSVNGAGGPAGKLLLEALGCDTVHLNGEPTGQFAHPPEPLAENSGELCDVVRREGADIGFAQDPDADRLAIVDNDGTYIGEEYTLALAAKHIFATRPGPAATNLSTSRMLDDLAEQAGERCAVHRTAVGEANVVEGMRRHHCVIAGEGNGGVIDPRVVPVRDSLVAIALVLQLLAEERKSLSEIVASMPRYAMIKQKFECSKEKTAEVLEAVRSQFSGERINDLDGVRIDWPEGWIHVRASNTEPIIRIIAEARDARTAQSLVDRVRKTTDPIIK